MVLYFLNRVQDKVDELLGLLPLAGVGNKPIIWICHSIGGIILADLITRNTDSSRFYNFNLRNLAQNTKGVVFFSTPHQGCPDAEILKYLLPSIKIDQIHPGWSFYK